MQKKNLRMVQLALLIAIQIVLTLTPLGFLRIGVMTVVLIHIPVLIGAIVIGPSAGAILGLVFGICSIVSAHMVGTPDVYVFSPFLSGSMWSVVVAVLPRVIFPIVAAYLYRFLKTRGVSLRIAGGIAAAVGTMTNTVLVLGSVYFLFGKLYASLVGIDYNTLFAAFAAVAATNGTIEVVVAVLAVMALVTPLTQITNQG